MIVTLLHLNMLCLEVDDHVDIFLHELVKFYLNNMVNLHPLFPNIIPSYTHKMANLWRPMTIDFVASFHSMYNQTVLSKATVMTGVWRGNTLYTRELRVTVGAATICSKI